MTEVVPALRPRRQSDFSAGKHPDRLRGRDHAEFTETTNSGRLQ